MKLNLALPASQVEIARNPELGVDSLVYFSPENCQLHGLVTATAATTADWQSAGGPPLPDAGRDFIVRVHSSDMQGGAGAMAVTLNVVLDDASTDTAVATFEIPTHTPYGGNRFPINISSDLIPAGVGNSAKKIRSITSIASVANMVAGSQFEVWSTPDSSSFVFIDCVRSKGGEEILPVDVPIACGRNPQAYTVPGRPDVKNLSFTLANRGSLEQLQRFNGHQGTARLDVQKSGYVISERILYTNFRPAVETPRGDGNDEAEGSTEGPYRQCMKGYFRISA